LNLYILELETLKNEVDKFNAKTWIINISNWWSKKTKFNLTYLLFWLN
jgi:hypothetical protein